LESYSWFELGLSFTLFTSFITFKQGDIRRPRSTYPDLLARHRASPLFVAPWYRNINLFPFRAYQLRVHLGPTNSSPTTRCEETLALSADGILTHLCFYSHQDLRSEAVHRKLPTCFCPPRTPPYRIMGFYLPCPRVSVADLSPVHFRGYVSRQMSCYTLVREWLLLYLSFCCFRNITPFSLTLNLHLGTLARV
jgi:hypothetical protein